MKVVLDTSAYSAFATGDARMVDILVSRARRLFLPAPVIGELTYGFLKGSRTALNESKLHDFIARLGVAVIAVDADVARKYGGIYLSLVRKGRKIPLNDVWVAACCMAVGGTLLTRDRHFAVIEQIEQLIV